MTGITDFQPKKSKFGESCANSRPFFGGGVTVARGGGGLKPISPNAYNIWSIVLEMALLGGKSEEIDNFQSRWSKQVKGTKSKMGGREA